MREFARTLFITTEGRLRLGTGYVYPGKRILNRVDIHVDRDGRANANPDLELLRRLVLGRTTMPAPR